MTIAVRVLLVREQHIVIVKVEVGNEIPAVLCERLSHLVLGDSLVGGDAVERRSPILVLVGGVGCLASLHKLLLVNSVLRLEGVARCRIGVEPPRTDVVVVHGLLDVEELLELVNVAVVEIDFVNNALHDVNGNHSEGVNELKDFVLVLLLVEVIVNVLLKNLAVNDIAERLEITDTGRTADKVVVNLQIIGGKKENMAAVAAVNTVHNGKEVLACAVLVLTALEAEVLLELVEEIHAVVIDRGEESSQTRIRLVADNHRESELVGEILCCDSLSSTLSTVQQNTKVVLMLLPVVGVENMLNKFLVKPIQLEIKGEGVPDSFEENFTRHGMLDGTVDTVIQGIRSDEIVFCEAVDVASSHKNFCHINILKLYKYTNLVRKNKINQR